MIKDFFKNAKNQMSLKVSKKIGGAKEVDKAIEEYKSKLQPLIDQEVASIKKIVDMKNGMDENADDSELKELKNKVAKEQDNIDKQREAIKNTFNIKVNKIKSDTDDTNIKYYVNLKRAELAEQILAGKLDKMEEIGANEMEGDEYVSDIVGGMKEMGEKATGFTKKIFGKLKDILSGSGDESPIFDTKEAREDVNYKWKESPYWKADLKPGTELTFWSNDDYEDEGDDYKGTEASVREDQEIENSENNIAVITDSNEDGFSISKGKIISTKEDAESEAKEEEEEAKSQEQENNDQEGEESV